MEKKNTILLTVIAIATLLVAVVGATFAYFTATVTTDQVEENGNSVNIKTYALAQAKMTMGDRVEVTNAYPGYKDVKDVTITGKCAEDQQTCDPVNAVIKVLPDVKAPFTASDVKWTLYEEGVSKEAITCQHNPGEVNGQYFDNGECDTKDAKAILSGTTEADEYAVSVSNGMNTTYYLVVEYVNNTNAPQNEQQGQSFSVALDFVAQQTNPTVEGE